MSSLEAGMQPWPFFSDHYFALFSFIFSKIFHSSHAVKCYCRPRIVILRFSNESIFFKKQERLPKTFGFCILHWICNNDAFLWVYLYFSDDNDGNLQKYYELILKLCKIDFLKGSISVIIQALKITVRLLFSYMEDTLQDVSIFFLSLC